MKKFFVFLCCLTFGACASSEDIFSDIGTNMASPTGLVVDSANSRLYVSNSNSKVLFDWQQGNFQVLDISSPQSPTLLNTAQTKSFSGNIYLDTANLTAYVTNRFSVNAAITQDNLLIINIDEASTNFLNVTELATNLNPFGLYCCSPANTLLMTSTDGVLQHVDISQANLTVDTTSLLLALSNGSTLSSAEVMDLVIIGEQAFLSRDGGGVLVVNLAELADSTKLAVDYFISDIVSPRGMATDGTFLYVTDADVVDGSFIGRVLKVDVSTLTALTDNDAIQIQDKEDDSLASASIQVGANPENILIVGTQAFVASTNDDNVSVIDLSSDTVTNTITVGEEPYGLAVDSPGGVPTTLYVSNVEGNTISIIDIASLTVVGTYP